MKGYELIKVITERRIKDNTTIKVKMGNTYKATFFEVIEENKEIEELPNELIRDD